MNRFYILAFYFAIKDSQASPGSDLNVEIQLDIAGKRKSHEDCPHKNAEHKTEGHGHRLHDLPGMFSLLKQLYALCMLQIICILKVESSKTYS